MICRSVKINPDDLKNPVKISIPRYVLCGQGKDEHYEYEIKVSCTGSLYYESVLYHLHVRLFIFTFQLHVIYLLLRKTCLFYKTKNTWLSYLLTFTCTSLLLVCAQSLFIYIKQ